MSPLQAATSKPAERETISGPSSNKMSFIIVSLLTLLVSISAFSARTGDAKPLNQNQVRFRRVPPREFASLLGSSITIECEAGSSPPAKIHWLKNGKRIQQADSFDENLLDDGQQRSSRPVDDINRIALSSTRSRLFIDCADFEDEATYTCVAENIFSRIASNTKLNIIKPLLVVSANSGPADNNLLAAGADTNSDLAPSPVAAVVDQQQEAAEASLSALPQCLSERNSRPSEPARIYMWTHNIVEIMKNDLVLYCRSNVGRQTITRGQQQQQEAALAVALAAAVSPDQTLSELMSNKLSEKQQAASTQPQLESSSSGGGGGGGGGGGKISWTLPDDRLVSHEHKDKFQVLETGDLLIKDLRWEDMGSYVCTVSNELGSDSVSTFVYPASVKSIKSKRASAFKTSD